MTTTRLSDHVKQLLIAEQLQYDALNSYILSYCAVLKETALKEYYVHGEQMNKNVKKILELCPNFDFVTVKTWLEENNKAW